MNNKINLHALRREHANDFYQFFENIILTVNGFARSLRERLIKMFERGNYDLYKANPQKYEAKLKRFIDDMNDTPYELRGENKKRDIQNGKPVIYNRLALMAVSVLALIHWRLDVTVVNYIV